MRIIYSLFIVLFIFINNLKAQDLQKIYETSLDKQIHKSILNGEAETFISPDADYLIINTGDHYRLYSLKDQQEIASGEYLRKQNKNFNLASSLVGGRTGAMIDNISYSEGTGFWIFDQDNVIIFLDWNVDENIIRAYDLDTGEKLWETSEYRFSPEKDKQTTSILATIAAQQVAYETLSAGAMIGTSILQYTHNQMISGNGGYGSSSARAYVVPLEGSSAFILQTPDSLISLNVNTGEKNWVYDDYPVMIGDYEKVPGENEILLVNFNPSFFAKSENLVFKLDTETGEELLRIPHLANFIQDRIYVEGKRLILDYYGAEVYDLQTGERIFITAGEKAMKQSNARLIPGGDYEIADPSWIKDGILYNGYYTMGGKLYPNVGAARKPQFSAWDLESGEKLYTTEELDKGSSIQLVSDDNLILTNVGIGNTELLSISRETGEMNHEPVKTKQALFIDNRVNALFITDDNIVQNGKKGLHYFDRNSLEEKHFAKTKKARVGDPFKFGRYDDGILMFAENGIAFYDLKGELLFSEKIKNIQSGAWSDDYLVVFTEGNLFSKGEMILFSINDKKAQQHELAAEMIFTPDLKHWVTLKENQNKLDVYKVR